MYKKLTLFVALTTSMLFGADTQLMFGDYESYDRTGYFNADMKFSNLNNKGTNAGVIFLGAGGGMQFNNLYYVGGALYSSTQNFLANGNPVNNGLSFTYGGGVFNQLIEAQESLHFLVGGLLGLGVASDTTSTGTPDLVVVFEPEVAVEFNVTNFTKIKIGWSWRITQGVDEEHSKNGWNNSSWFSGYGDMMSINFGLTFGEY